MLPTFSKAGKTDAHEVGGLKEELEVNGSAIPQEQFVFRTGHSCVLQTLRVGGLIASGMDSNKTTAIGYLAISKAFDRVWHQGLIYKRNQLGLLFYCCLS